MFVGDSQFMPVEISWYQENYILYSRYTGELTMDTIRDGIHTAMKMVLSQSHPVPHIVDFTEMTSIHHNLKDFSQIGNELKGIDKRNWVIIIGVTGIPKFVANMITQIANLNCKMADSLEEARTFATQVSALNNVTAA